MEILIFYSILIAVLAVVYRLILADEPVLNWWFRWGLRYEKRWFWKPVWGCELCFAGQVALWTYVLNGIFGVIFSGNAPISRLVFFVIPKYDLEKISVFSCLIFISLSILFTFLLAKFYTWLKNGNS